MQVLNYCLGVDVSKDKIDCCINQLNSLRSISKIAESVFSNQIKGFSSLLDWITSVTKPGIKLTIVMEATGVYYENLAHFLHNHAQYKISVVLPAKAKYYFKSLSIKTKTDKVDAQMLSQFGLERSLNTWEPASKNMHVIKQLSRKYRDLKIQLNRLKNKLHAIKHSYLPSVLAIKLLNQNIELLENQCLEIEVELRKIVFEIPFLKSKLEKVCTIPGIQFMTAITIISETNGFHLIKNAKQLCSYAGLDIKHKSSGNKVGVSKISKQGNRYIRQAIYMPSLSASRYIGPLSKFYKRINEKNKSKKVGLIAVARKLLILTYTIWRKDEDFDSEYVWQEKK